MKNRTIIGVICILMSIVLVFIAAPEASKLSEQTVSIYVFDKDINAGTEITEKMVSTAKILKTEKPSNAVSELSSIVGKYTKTNVFKGDYITQNKITPISNSTENVLANLKDGEVVISMKVDMLNTVSDNIERGDIIKIYSTKKSANTTTTVTNNALQYIKVIATTTKAGIESEDRTTDESGKKDEIATLVLLMTDKQVEELRTLQKDTTVSVGLVCKASDSARAEDLLKKQAAIFKSATSGQTTDTTKTG